MAIKYKVVRGVDEDGKVKYYSSYEATWGRVEYKINEWVRAPRPFRDYGYYLYVFNDKQIALDYREFLMDYNGITSYAFTCEVKGRRRIKRVPYNIFTVDINCKEHLWEFLKKGNKKEAGVEPLDGTELWEYVKITDFII